MKKLTFMSQQLKSDNNFNLYKVKFYSTNEWIDMRRWMNRWATSDFVFSERNEVFFDRDTRSRYYTKVVGFKSMKDSLAFSIKFDRFDDVKVWSSDELFTRVQFIE